MLAHERRWEAYAQNKTQETLSKLKTRPHIGWCSLPKGKSVKDAIGLRVAGDCLAPEVNDGDVVVLDSKVPKPGELAVIWFKGAAPIIKYLVSDLTFFYPYNPKSEIVLRAIVRQTNPMKQLAFELNDRVECIASVRTVFPADTFHTVTRRPA